MAELLRFDRVEISYDEYPAVRDVNMTLHEGEILAVDAGDPTCLTPFHSDTIKAFNGLASVIIKVKPGAKGKIVVTATSNGLKKGKTKIKHL